MVKYSNVIKAIDEYLKCTITVKEMHSLLDKWTPKQKRMLLRWGLGLKTQTNEEYDNVLEKGDEDEIFDYERQIFDVLNKTQRNNLLQYCTDFDDYSYNQDIDDVYPNDFKNDIELAQDDLQEDIGYSYEIIDAITSGWCGGGFDIINKYIMNKGTSKESNVPSHYKEYGDNIMEYIENSEGLIKDTVLFRSGHWDIGSKVGDVKEIPCLNSLTYWKSCADYMGQQSQKNLGKNPYNITVYAPKGTKGINCNAPSLSEYPEHEYLINKGQKYIVLNVDDNNKTASILLID